MEGGCVDRPVYSDERIECLNVLDFLHSSAMNFYVQRVDHGA